MPSNPSGPQVVPMTLLTNEMTYCALCKRPADPAHLAEVDWVGPAVLDRLANQNSGWQYTDGACPACVQQALLQVLLEQGEGHSTRPSRQSGRWMPKRRSEPCPRLYVCTLILVILGAG